MRLREIFAGRRLPTHWALLVGLALAGIIGAIDYITGYELGFSILYVVPVGLVTWLAGLKLGLAFGFVSAGIWVAADIAAGHEYSHPLYAVWNALIRLAFFVIITYLLAALRSAMQRTEELSHVDELTGAVNSRSFYALLAKELDRLERYGHPLSMAYVDLDGFKSVNDTRGHLEGDAVLRLVAECAKSRLRKTDVVARLGGDEFAFLCPETDEESARSAISEVRDRLLEAMQAGGWPVTFSMGVLTCHVAPDTNEDLVRMADDLMYSVKLGTKNAVRFASFRGIPADPTPRPDAPGAAGSTLVPAPPRL